MAACENSYSSALANSLAQYMQALAAATTDDQRLAARSAWNARNETAWNNYQMCLSSSGEGE